MSADHTDSNYTKPELRERLKSEIQASSKGGRKGQWSARKSQMLVRQYEQQGGGYHGDKNHDEAKSLRTWTKEDWQTKNSSGHARTGKTMKRYLPKQAWDLLSAAEQRATETKKTSHGEQYVANTEPAKAARSYVVKGDPSSLNEQQLNRLTKETLVQIARKEDLPQRSKMNKAQLARTLRKHFRTES